MNIKVKNILCLFGMIALTGCLSPVKNPSEIRYQITAVPKVSRSAHSHPVNLMVMMPEILPAYNTTQMAYTAKRYQLSYFSVNQWAETPAQMLYPLIIQTLQNTHYFHAIITPPFMGNYDYILNTQILKLTQNLLTHPSQFQLSLRLQLYRTIKNQVVSTKTIDINVPLINQTPYDGVVAANIATEKALKQIAKFTIEHSTR